MSLTMSAVEALRERITSLNGSDMLTIIACKITVIHTRRWSPSGGWVNFTETVWPGLPSGSLTLHNGRYVLGVLDCSPEEVTPGFTGMIQHLAGMTDAVYRPLTTNEARVVNWQHPDYGMLDERFVFGGDVLDWPVWQHSLEQGRIPREWIQSLLEEAQRVLGWPMPTSPLVHVYFARRTYQGVDENGQPRFLPHPEASPEVLLELAEREALPRGVQTPA